MDMSELEAQFDDVRLSKDMDNESFERMTFLRDRMGDLEEMMSFHQGMVDSAKDEVAHIRELEARIEALARKMRARRAPIDAEATKINELIRKDERKLDSLKREFARLLQEIEARRKLRAEQAALDEKTKEAPWRQRALKHQLEGAHRLVSAERGILGDKPGLGKTLQAIMTIDMLRATGKAKKVLVFVPKAVLQGFKREFDKWAPDHFVHILDHAGKGNKSMLLDVVQHMPEIIILTNYEVWRKDKTIIDKMIACQFDTLILDEAHVLKEKSSGTFKGIRKIRYAENKCPQCGSSVISSGIYGQKCGQCEYSPAKFDEFCSIQNVVPMTGTSILNKPSDLWPLLNLIDRSGFPEERYFLQDYCTQKRDQVTEKLYWTFGSGGSERLLKKLGMKYTARTRESAGVVMPPQEVKHHQLELSPETHPRHHKFVQILKDKAQLAFGDERMTQLETIQWYTRMRQAASWPDMIQVKECTHEPHCIEDKGENKCFAPEIVFPPPGAPPVGESIIMDASEDIVKEAIESDNRIVVFSHFNGVLEELRRRCEDVHGMRVAVFNGKTPEKDRDGIIRDFDENLTPRGRHKYDVLLCQYKTGSVGINLQGAQEVLFVEREWNPGKEEQASDRVRRIDSKYDSTVHVLHAEGTATDLVDTIIAQKKDVIEGFESDVNLMEAMRKFLEGDK